MNCNAVHDFLDFITISLSYTGTESSLYELSHLFEALLTQFNIPLDVESNNKSPLEWHNFSLLPW